MKNTLRIIFAVLLVLVMAFSFTACGDESASSLNDTAAQNSSSDGQSSTQNSSENSDSEAVDGVVKAEIVIKNYGTIKLDLYSDEAPITVANFTKLAKDGFYDGLTFHRIIKDFMMQGGDPKGDGTGGAENDIQGEFGANGFSNPIAHVRGVVSMARAGYGYDTASSQFFIVHKDTQSTAALDTWYAAFGRVIEGMEIVDKICDTVQPIDDEGTVLREDQPKIKSITID